MHGPQLVRGADGRLYELARGNSRVVQEPARRPAPAVTAAGSDDHVAGRAWIDPGHTAPANDDHVAGRAWITPEQHATA